MNNQSAKFHLSPKQVINIFLLVVLLIFIGQNVHSVSIKFLLWRLEMPVIIIILASFFMGFYTSRAFSKKIKPEKDKVTELVNKTDE